MEKLLLGIDIGTSACKVSAFDVQGKVIASASGKYEVFQPHKGWAEQNPLDWWNAIVDSIRQILLTVSADNIAAIGIDGQSWSAIPIDKNYNVLCNTPIWYDMRAFDICDDIKKKYGKDAFFENSGNPFAPSYTLPKILWYKKHTPDVYKNAYKILQSNGYVALKLTGEISQDYSMGYGWQSYNAKKRTWNHDIMDELGLSSDLLPELCACHHVVGGVLPDVARETGLKVGTPVVAGGLDAACGTLGAGVIDVGQTQEQGGQAGGMSICTDECISHPDLILSDHVVSGKWLLQGGTVGGGGVLRWFEEQFGHEEREKARAQGKSSFEILSDMADTVSAGSDGLVFLPYMAGERSPIWDADAKGVYFGVDYRKTKAHFVRSSMEGVALSLEHNLSVARDSGVTVKTLHAMGGAANSRVWTQLKADITGKTIHVPYSDAATTLGAVILAGVGVGIYSSFESAVATTVKVTRTHTPNPEKHEMYKSVFNKYIALYKSTAHLMKEDF